MLQLFIKYKLIPAVILFVTGIFSAFIFRSNLVLFISSALLMIISAVALSKSIYTALPLFLLFFISGNYYSGLFLSANDDLFISQYSANNIKLNGVVKNISPANSRNIRFDFYVTSYLGQKNSKQMPENPPVIKKEKPVKLICRIYPGSAAEYDSIYNMLSPGALYKITGDFRNFSGKRNPGEFDFAFFYRNDGYKGQLTADDINYLKSSDDLMADIESYILKLRNNIKIKLNQYYSPEASSVLSALITGDKSSLSDEIKENFRKSGVTHVLAVSGLHVGFIILIIGALLKRWGRAIYIPGVIAGIILFSLVSGFQAPVLRASVMALVFILAKETGRSSSGYNSLAIAALIILLFNPMELFKPGFQLSFIAALSIIYGNGIAKKFSNYMRSRFTVNDKFRREYSGSLIFSILTSASLISVISYLIITFIILLFTSPVIIYYFGEVSLIAMISNAAVIPLISILLANGITVLFLSLFTSAAAQVFALSGDLVFNLTNRLTTALSGIDFLILNLRQFSLTAAMIFAFHLLLLPAVLAMKSGIRRTTAIIIFTISILSWTGYANSELPVKGKLNIIMADAGQGDAFLLVTPENKSLLIDAGALNIHSNAAEKYIIPLLSYLGIKKIDLGIISHWDNDHAGGFLYLAEQGFIKKIITPPPARKDDSVAIMYLDFLKRKNVETVQASDGFFSFGSMHLTLFAVPGVRDSSAGLSSNEASELVKAQYGKIAVLFTGDIPVASEKILTEKYGEFLKSEILKVSHHGSKTGTSDLFLDAVQPGYALISAGRGNSFNHPSPEVIERLKRRGVSIQRTDTDGCRILTSDGEKIFINEWR